MSFKINRIGSSDRVLCVEFLKKGTIIDDMEETGRLLIVCNQSFFVENGCDEDFIYVLDLIKSTMYALPTEATFRESQIIDKEININL